MQLSSVRSGRGVELLQGEGVTLLSSAARGATAGTNGTAVALQGERRRFVFLLDVTAAATDVTDTLDVYIDAQVGSTFVNAIHFTQCTGTGGAKKYFAVLDASNPGTSVIDVTSDAAAGAVRPALFGDQFRARWVIVDPGAGAASFTFSVTGYAL